MVAPLLQVAAAAGVLGGRFLGQRRQNAAYQSAVQALLDPSTGAGQLPLGDRQIAAVQALAGQGQAEAAFDYAVAQAQRNQSATLNRQGLEMQGARLQMQRMSHAVRQEELEQQRAEFAYEQQLDARALDEWQRSLSDPALAQSLAIRDNRDFFLQVDEAGTATRIPVRGSDLWRQDVSQYQNTLRGSEVMGELIDLVDRVGPTDDPSSEVRARMRSLYGELAGIIKTDQNLGALDAGVLEFVNRLVPDPTSFVNNLVQDRESLLAGLGTARQGFQQSLRDQLPIMRDLQGLPSTFANRTARALDRPELTNEDVIQGDIRSRLQRQREIGAGAAVEQTFRGVVNALQEINPF